MGLTINVERMARAFVHGLIAEWVA
jgi:hypothetical protein